MRLFHAIIVAVGILVMAVVATIALVMANNAPTNSPSLPVPTVTQTVEVPVPSDESLAEWEAELVRREKEANERDAEVEEWIEHLKGREKAILAAEETCEF